MAETKTQAPPECFARLEKVFPMGCDGLRQTPAECLDCDIKTECLRAAVTGEQGLAVQEERLKRAYQAGSVGFLERWAQQKALERCRKKGAGWLGFWSRLRPPARPGRPEAGEASTVNMKNKSRIGRTVVIMVVAIFLASCLVVFGLLNSSLWDKLMGYYDLMSDREWVRATIKSAGWSAALVFIGLQIGQVLLAPIPGEVTGFLGGYMFGVLSGFLLSTIGLIIGSMINFWIGRILGERVVRRLVRCETYEKYNEMVQFKGILFIFIFFLVPGFPKDYLCMFLGLTTLPARVFFVITTAGRLPGTLALSLQGASIFERDYMFFVIVTLLCALFALVAYLVRDPLYRWMARHSKKRTCEPSL
jgi:uncharacterized membrane protein YdjX (TVP38/TMEM64 family)